MIEQYSVNYYVAVAAQLQADKLINFYASDDVIYCLFSADGNLQRKLDLSNWRVN